MFGRWLSAGTRALSLVVVVETARAAIDVTSANRRAPVSGLVDWSKAGYEKGAALPDDCKISYTIGPDKLASQFGVIPDDGKDDTDGLYAAITSLRSITRAAGTFALIQLPPGKIQLSHRLSLDVSYTILRGAGNDPANGGTVIEFAPDANTAYDTLTSDGARWDQSNSGFSWEYKDEKNKTVKGTAGGGWIWPGRPIIQVGSTAIAPKYTVPYSLAPSNRKDLFWGSVNYHFRNDSTIKGFMADQRMDIVGKMGDTKIYYDSVNTTWAWAVGQEAYVYSPIRSTDYDSWAVTDASFYVDSYMFQDWFTVASVGKDTQGSFIVVDRPLRFNVYSSSTAAGGKLMETAPNVAKIMPIEDPIHHVGIENLYITQPMASLTPAQAVHNYGNMAPAQAMHGIVFRFARDSWVRGVSMYMIGSHPIATESARNLHIQDNFFDGSWNKGSGGNGYIRGSRVFDSVFVGNKLRNLRHFALQWSSMGNVVVQNDLDCDLNLHGGWEGFNLIEGNAIVVPYDHRSRSCTANCGGEGTGLENGTWFPIYWSAGAKASKWSGATGPQNVFFRNTMKKAKTATGAIEDFTPYYSSDGSTASKVFEFGWSATGYKHLSLDGTALITDWMGNEQATFAAGLVTATQSTSSIFLTDPTKTRNETAACRTSSKSRRGHAARNIHRLV
ncbi:hypothetical protein BKA62DRAFT_824692 [Auriculariales sp. MPI-PUGE-AT-0066]|nr:hypothetical protein BKA62DRAFT_824692 [Auriculariales sp. MPI-PUGE-AT-0066]